MATVSKETVFQILESLPQEIVQEYAKKKVEEKPKAYFTKTKISWKEMATVLLHISNAHPNFLGEVVVTTSDAVFLDLQISNMEVDGKKMVDFSNLRQKDENSKVEFKKYQ